MTDALRRTGRTTRMMNIAKSIAAEGLPVVVIVDNEMQARTIRKDFGCSLGWPAVLPRFHWSYDQSTNTVRGLSRHTVVLIDHFAKECMDAERRAAKEKWGAKA
jgi:hypothetical protein